MAPEKPPCVLSLPSPFPSPPSAAPGTPVRSHTLPPSISSTPLQSRNIILVMNTARILLSRCRGGVPICFPQFSNFGRLGQHGFARNKQFKVVEQNEWSVTMVSCCTLCGGYSERSVAMLSYCVTCQRIRLSMLFGCPCGRVGQPRCCQRVDVGVVVEQMVAVAAMIGGGGSRTSEYVSPTTTAGCCRRRGECQQLRQPSWVLRQGSPLVVTITAHTAPCPCPPLARW